MIESGEDDDRGEDLEPFQEVPVTTIPGRGQATYQFSSASPSHGEDYKGWDGSRIYKI